MWNRRYLEFNVLFCSLFALHRSPCGCCVLSGRKYIDFIGCWIYFLFRFLFTWDLCAVALNLLPSYRIFRAVFISFGIAWHRAAARLLHNLHIHSNYFACIFIILMEYFFFFSCWQQWIGLGWSVNLQFPSRRSSNYIRRTISDWFPRINRLNLVQWFSCAFSFRWKFDTAHFSSIGRQVATIPSHFLWHWLMHFVRFFFYIFV